MEILLQQRCHHHAQREAVARCPECSRYFCRECITEHEDRVICAGCLKKLAEQFKAKTHRFRAVWRVFQCLLGAVTLWLLFYVFGQWLISMPSSFHEGTLWGESWWASEDDK